MSTRELSLNSVLCFMFTSKRKYSNTVIKSIVKDFYSVDSLCKAKSILGQDISKAGINVKIPPKRRTSDNKLKLDIDDIINLIDSVDELQAYDKLPRYVTDDLDDIPVFKMDAGGLAVLLAKLDSIEDKVGNYWYNASCPSTAQPPAQVQDVDVDGVNNGDSLSSDPFEEVVSKQKRRKINAGRNFSVPSANPTPKPSQPPNGGKKLYSAVANTNQPVSRKQSRVIGRSNIPNTQSALKSAKPYVKKQVYGVYNIDPSETVESVEQFVTNICGSKPITCFQSGQGSQVDGNVSRMKTRAFRICINAQYADKFLNPDLWDNGIVIRKWRFKPKVSPADNANTQQING